MARDPRKLRVFHLADAVVPDIYAATKDFPTEERYGLVAQMRRASVSIPSNIVEGCARRTTNDYLNFLNIANGSAYELGYLVTLSAKLGMMNQSRAQPLADRCDHIAASLTALIDSFPDGNQKPDQRSGTGRPKA
jgi:four helix bundle protein